jgi:hypothetical protein
MTDTLRLARDALASLLAPFNSDPDKTFEAKVERAPESIIGQVSQRILNGRKALAAIDKELAEGDWRETGRDLYDDLITGKLDYTTGQDVVRNVVRIIERRHRTFFFQGTERPQPVGLDQHAEPTAEGRGEAGAVAPPPPPWLTPAVQERATTEVRRLLVERGIVDWRPIDGPAYTTQAPWDGKRVKLFFLKAIPTLTADDIQIGVWRDRPCARGNDHGRAWFDLRGNEFLGKPTHWAPLQPPSTAVPDLATQIVLAVLAACVPDVEAMAIRMVTEYYQRGKLERLDDMRRALLAAMRGE